MSSLLKSFSIEKNLKKITVINIAPDHFKTKRVEELVTNFRKFENSLPLKKIGDPEIGKFVKFIVENEIKYITGSTVYFDGNINKSFI